MQYLLHQLKLLVRVAKFNALKLFAYPWEWVAFFVQRFISLSFLALFWFAVARSSAIALNFQQLIAYFLVAGAVQDLIFASDTRLGREIMRLIKSGEISNYLIKPIAAVPFLFSTYIGQAFMRLIYGIVTLTIGIVILPPVGIVNIIAFILFLFLSFILSIGFNLFVAIMSFYVVEAGGIRNVFNHITRILSGGLIPLTLFPAFLRSAAMMSPFPLVAFTPTYVLQNSLSFGELLNLFLVSAVWAAGFLFLMNLWWKKSLKQYEGVGI